MYLLIVIKIRFGCDGFIKIHPHYLITIIAVAILCNYKRIS